MSPWWHRPDLFVLTFLSSGPALLSLMLVNCPTVTTPTTPATPNFPVDISRGFQVRSDQVVDPSLGRIRDLGDRWRFEPSSLEAAKTFLTKCPALPNPGDNPVFVAKSLVNIKQAFRNSDSEVHSKPTKSKSLPVNCDRQESLLAVKMTGTCSWCHGPTGPAHPTSPWGYNRCTLSHSSLCKGGVEAILGKKMGCPAGYLEGMDMKYADDPRESTDSSSDVSTQHLSQLELETVQETEDLDDKSGSDDTEDNLDRTRVKPSSAMLVTPANLVSGSAVKLSTDTLVTATTSISHAPFTSLQYQFPFTSSNPSLLPQSYPATPVSSLSVTDLGQSVFLQQLSELKTQQVLQEKKQMEQESNMLLVQKQLHEAQKLNDQLRNEASVRRKSTRTVSFSTGGSASDLAIQSEKLRAKAARKALKKQNNIGTDMNEIRKTPGLSDRVEQYVEKVSTIPSLSAGAELQPSRGVSNRPEASLDGAGAVGTGVGTDQSVMSSFMFQQQSLMAEQMRAFATFQQQQEAARIQHQQQVQSWIQQIQLGQGTSQATPYQPHKSLSPTSAEKRAARKAAEKAKDAARQAKLKARKDEKVKADSEYEEAVKKLEKLRRAKIRAEKRVTAGSDTDNSDATDLDLRPPPSQQIPDSKSGTISSDESVDNKQLKKAAKKLKQKAKKRAELVPASNSDHQVNSARPQAPVPRSAKQGNKEDTDKDRVLSVADWAKLCPVKYASSCTAKNVNLSMWVWGKIAELRAALTGATRPLAPGELEARLHHWQCVLQVCNENAQPTDFTPHGWQIARSYDSKVQTLMDSGVSDWVTFNAQCSLGPHPSFFLSAINEAGKPTKKKEQQDNKDPKKKPVVCEKFNHCKTKKKCDFEVENPRAGRCKRLHECAYCQKNRGESLFHQWWDCGHGGRDTYAAENE